MKRNDSIGAKVWTRDLSSIPALAMRLAERCRTISTPFLSAPRVQAGNHRLLERPLPGNLRLGGQRLRVADSCLNGRSNHPRYFREARPAHKASCRERV